MDSQITLHDIATRVEGFRSGLQPRYLDILSSLGSSQSVVIDGDAILLQALTDPDLSLSEGFQWATLFYLVEQAVLPFLDRKARLQVVFFKDHEELFYAESPTLRLARRAVVRHVAVNLGLKVVDDIDNWWSSPWAAFMASLSPAFLILDDGEKLSVPNLSLGMQQGERHKGHVDRMQLALHSFLVHTLIGGQTCAFLNQCTTKDHSILAFSLEPRSTNLFTRGHVGALGRHLAEAGQLSRQDGLNGDGEEARDFLGFCRTLVHELKKRDDGEAVPVDAATLSIMWACARILKQDHELKDLVAIFLLHWAVLRHLPLQLRAQKASPVPSPPKDQASQFLERIYSELLLVATKETLDQLRPVTSYPVVSNEESSIPRSAAVQTVDVSEGTAEGKRELLDFGDGRLFHLLARKYLSAGAHGDLMSAPLEEAARFVVPGDLAQRVRWLWAVVSAETWKLEAGVKAPGLSFELIEEEEPVDSFWAAVEPGEEPRGQDADQSNASGVETSGAAGREERCLEVCDCAATAGLSEL